MQDSLIQFSWTNLRHLVFESDEDENSFFKKIFYIHRGFNRASDEQRVHFSYYIQVKRDNDHIEQSRETGNEQLWASEC